MEPQKPSISALPGPGAFDTTNYLASPVCYDLSSAAFDVQPKLEDLDPNLMEKKRRKAVIVCTLLIAALLALSTLIILGICHFLDPRPHP